MMRFRGAWWLIASALVVAGCGGSNTLITPQAAPSVNSVTPATGSTGVAVTAPITATFNEVMNATTFTSSTFTLKAAGGAAVTGNVSYSSGTSTAVFTPASPLAYNTVYTATITTGVQNPAGTALGSSDTWSFTTATGPAPTVSAVTPGNGSTGLAANTTVTATFSEAMNASTITASTFTLTPQGGTAVSATVSYNATTFTATLTPNAPLAANTTYTAAVTTGAVGATGSALANVNSWSFTTAQGPVPTVAAVTPTSGTTGVAIASTVTAVFSESMDPSTVTNSTFTLTGSGNAAVAGTIAVSTTNVTNDTVTFTPSAPLAYNTTYTALITTGVQAASQVPEVPLAANYTWSFTTAPPPPATVSAVSPASGSTGIPITGTTVTATFGAAMTASTINPSTFTVTGPSGALAGTVSYNATTFTATFTPSVSLAYGATYTATIGTGVTSSLGGPLPAPYTWSFTTVKATVPTVSSVVPTNGATNVNTAGAVTATFSEPMNAGTLTTSAFTLTTGGAPVAGTVTYSSGTDTATFTPSVALAPGTAFTATITTGAQGSTGAALASAYTWSFTTGSSPSAAAVSFGTTYQTIQGFGGSTAWLGQMPAKVATALFGSGQNDLNLSILRVRIDPEGSAAGGGTNNMPYETSEWDYEAANGAEAVANNPNAVVFATPWTPPYAWKLNGSSNLQDDGETWNQSFNSTCGEGYRYCGGYLDQTNHGADYAHYLEDFVHFFNSVNSFNLYAISMQNEPEENVTYESCVWTPEEMDTWVANDASIITSDPYSTKLIMPESDTFNPVDAAATLNDPSAEGLVSIIGGHIYGGPPTAPYSIPAGDTPKAVWMTEFGPLSSATLTFAQALTPYGVDIHDSLVNGNYNAFVWWGLFGDTTGSCATAAGTCGFVDASGNLQPMGEIMGQYSKFIQPGYVRASATATPTTGVYVSAYTGLDQSANQHYVLVVINTNTTLENINFTLSGAPTTISSLTPTQSTSAGGLVPQTAVTVTGGQFYYTMPAQSIVTFVQ